MTKKDDQRLLHARHNETVCDHLSLQDQFSDWVITTAFYSALHYVSHKIFPFDVTSTSGAKISMRSIDEYCNLKNYKSITKHRALIDLVYEKCSPIGEDYEWLYDMSYNARYSNYQQDLLVSKKAKALLLTIKKFCS